MAIDRNRPKSYIAREKGQWAQVLKPKPKWREKPRVREEKHKGMLVKGGTADEVDDFSS